MTMTSRSWAMLAALSFLWGSSFVLIELSLNTLPPTVAVFWRVLIAALALSVFLGIRRQGMTWHHRLIGQLFLMGMLNNVIPFSLIFWGQTFITAGLASILNATVPIFTIILAALLPTDETTSARQIIGVIAGFVGVAVLIGPVALGASEGGGTLLGQLAILGAALSYAAAALYGRRFSKTSIPLSVVATGQAILSTIPLLVLIFLAGHQNSFFPQDLSTWGALLGLGLFSTALAYLLYFTLLAEAGATNTGLVTLLIPIWAVSLGIIFLNETLSTNQVLGVVIILASLVFMDGRLTRVLRIGKRP